MATQQQVEQQRLSLIALVELARRLLSQFWLTLDPGSPNTRKQVADFYVSLTQQVGSSAASIAADFYDEVRAEADVRRGFQARVADPVSSDQVERVANWATRDLSRITLQEPPVQRVRDNSRITLVTPEQQPQPQESTPEQRLTQAVHRLVLQPARDTIVDSVARDPAGAKWARVPSGAVTCAFCLVLASRGAAYESAHAAEYRGMSMTKYHDDCDCVPTPIWPGDAYPEGYDPDVLMQKYIDARRDVTKTDIKAALERRRQSPSLDNVSWNQAHTLAILAQLRVREGIR